MADKDSKGRFAKGNRAALVHGCFSLGKLPKGASHVRRLVGQLRAALRRLVREKDGGITLAQDGLIQSACRHELRALLLTRWLREAEALPLRDRLSVVREIGWATDCRDRCLKALGLDRASTIDPLSAWFASGNAQEGRQDDAGEQEDPRAACDGQDAGGAKGRPFLDVADDQAQTLEGK
jgi:hypothetical protein